MNLALRKETSALATAMMLQQPRGLRRNAALASLSKEALARIEPHLKTRDYAAGQMLWEAGGGVERVYFPLRGIISVAVPVVAPKLIEVAMIGPDAAAGGLAGPGDKATSGMVCAEGVFAAIQAAQLWALAAQSAEIVRLRRKAVEWMLVQARQRAACNAAHCASQRIASHLLQIADRAGRPLSAGIGIEATQDDIAHALGYTRSKVTLVMHNDFATDGLVSYRRGRIRIADRDRLRAAACACYGALRPAASPFIAASTSFDKGSGAHASTSAQQEAE